MLEFPPPHSSFPLHGSSFFPPVACFPPPLPLGHSTSEFFHLLGTFFLLTICIFSHFSLSFLGFSVAIPPLMGHSPHFFPSVACFSSFPLLWHHIGKFVNLLGVLFCSQIKFFPHYSLSFFGFGVAFPPLIVWVFTLCGLVSPSLSPMGLTGEFVHVLGPFFLLIDLFFPLLA